MDGMTMCSVDGCHQEAVAWLTFAGATQRFHVHVCGPHEREDREFCDVHQGGSLPCPPELGCTTEPLFLARPPGLP